MFGCHWKLKRGPAPWFQGYALKQTHKEEFVFDISESHTCKDTHFSQTEQARTTCGLQELTRFLEKRLAHSKHSTSCVCNSKDAKNLWHLSSMFSKHWEKGVLKWLPSMMWNQRQNLKVIPPWSNFFSNQLSFRLSACAYRLCLAPVSVHQENWLQQFTNWDIVSLDFFLFLFLFFASLFTVGQRAVAPSSTPDFCQLRFRGV